MKTCPSVLAYGTCSDPSCTLNHSPFVCEACSYIAPTQALLNIHLGSKTHRLTINQRRLTYLCTICNKNIGSYNWTTHKAGRPHRKLAKAQGISADVEPARGITDEHQIYCEICQYALPRHAWSRHADSPKHRGKESFLKYRSVLEEVEKDKNGLIVEGPWDLGFVDPTSAASGVQGAFVIKSSEPQGNSVLVSAKFVSTQGGKRFNTGFTITAAPIQTSITSQSPLRVAYQFSRTFIGRYEDRLELIFEDLRLHKKFIVSRPIQVIIGDQASHEALKPVKPYVPRQRKERSPVREVVPGVAPPSTNAIPYVAPLPRANIPKHLAEILGGSGTLAQQSKQIKGLFFSGALSTKNYARTFKHLLWIEEHKTESDLERYDMEDVKLAKHKQYYYLTIPGLAEKRPSVLVGDRILFQRQGSAKGRWYEGHVHVVRRNEVGLVFHTSFSGWTAVQSYNIRFKLNRVVIRRQHNALDSAFEEKRVLFPTMDQVLLPQPIRPLSLVNSLIGRNTRQLEAVSAIVQQQAGSPPFVVFGPPGTGKTVTIVEAIRQVLSTNRASTVLACAPSNSAADQIAEKLVASGLTQRELFRMYAPSRSKDQTPDKLRDYICTSPDGHFTVPHLDALKGYRVVVSTCVSASMLSGVGVPRGHFSYIFIDEAGQATEPEAFISIKTLADLKTNVILSGDPKQLGPIIRSGIARDLGLEKSYLDRLMEREAYDVQSGHAKTVVKLTKNYRSHAAILKFPNERFYAGDLEQFAPSSVIDAFLSSPLLPSPDFPIVFHSVIGKDDREASSPSFFNVDEVLQIKSYVQELMQTKGKFGASDADIGIIAPYHAQCLKIRTALRSVADGIKVGSVEEFQGQERKIIMISTVRSSTDFVTYDLRHTLGFVANPRRFNVAVTRAKALLVIVGNPHVLSLDPLWRSFLNYIYLQGGWTGPDIPWDPEEPVDEQGGYDAKVRDAAQFDMKEYAKRIEEVVWNGALDEGDIDVTVDRPWTDAE